MPFVVGLALKVFMACLGLFMKGLTAFLTRLLVSLASEQMIAWVFFKVADAVVKSTATTKDDEWLEKLREVYQSK